MTVERWRQIEHAFHAVVSAPPEERPAAIRRECGTDEELRFELEALVASHESGEPEHLSSTVDTVMAVAFGGDAFLVGQSIGSYRIIRLIGVGGMGQVFEAEDVRLNRRVAIKVLNPAMSRDSEMLARFEREAQLASSLNHPNILTVFDVGEHDGRRFLVTEFVEGQTLRERLCQGPMQEAEILSVIQQAAAGLECAHHAGIIHRDIKPENIMIRPDGVVRVLDFGLARPHQSSDLTSPQVILGTVPYMAPERFRRDQPDARSDIWSLGAVLYEMAAGSLPDSWPPPPLPVAMVRFDRVVHRALDPNPNTRYATITEILQDLEAVAQTESGLSFRKLALAVPVALILILAVWKVLDNRPAQTEGDQIRVTRFTTTGRTEFAALSPNGQFLAYTLSESNGYSLWVRQIAEVRDLQLAGPFRKTVGLSFSPTGDYVYYPVYADSRESTLYRLPVMGGDARIVAADVDSPVAPSPDNHQVAFIRINRAGDSLVIVPAAGGPERIVAQRFGEEQFRPSGPAWSPDGRIAAAAREKVAGRNKVLIRLYNPQGGPSTVLGPAWVDIHRIAWSSGGEYLYVAGRTEPDSLQVYRVSAKDGARRRVTTDLSDFLDVTAQSGGTVLCAIRRSRTTHLSVGTPPRRITTGAARYSSLAAAGPQLLTVSDASGAREIWSLDTDGAERRLTSDGRGKRDVHACPADGPIVYSAVDGDGWSIWRSDRDGSHARPLTSASCCDYLPRCSPDGRTILFQSDRSGRISAWRLPIDGGEMKLLSEYVCLSPAWSPDGTRFACHYNGPETAGAYRLAVFAAATGKPLQLLDGIPRGAQFQWDRTGDAILFAKTEGNVSNVWRRRFDQPAAEQVTAFTEDWIFDFVQTNSGELAFLRGIPGQDAVRIAFQ